MAEVLERGDVFFVYRPRVGEHVVESLADVQRMWMILSTGGRHRRLVIGKKRLPELRKHERHWAFVDRIATDPFEVTRDLHETHYWTKTRGMRDQAPARAAGEGVYAIVDHGDHRHLAYRLEWPEQPGEVQDALGISEEASYIVTVMNPYKPYRGEPREPRYPDRVRARFGADLKRRFATFEPDFLDYVGTELILIGTSDDLVGQLGLELDADREVADSADMFRWLAEEEGEHPLRPLFEGRWA